MQHDETDTIGVLRCAKGFAMPNNINEPRRSSTPPSIVESPTGIDEEPIVYLRNITRNGQQIQVTEDRYYALMDQYGVPHSPSSSDASSAPHSRSASITSNRESDANNLRMSMTGAELGSFALPPDDRRYLVAPQLMLHSPSRRINDRFTAQLMGFSNADMQRITDAFEQLHVHSEQTHETLSAYGELASRSMPVAEFAEEVCPITHDAVADLTQPVVVKMGDSVWRVFSYAALSQHWNTHHSNPLTRQRLAMTDIFRLIVMDTEGKPVATPGE
jgi:hypothetical protein